MIVALQTCAHRYAPLDNRPITVARKCMRCGQPEYWRTDIAMWVDRHGEPCSVDPGPPPPKVA